MKTPRILLVVLGVAILAAAAWFIFARGGSPRSEPATAAAPVKAATPVRPAGAPPPPMARVKGQVLSDDGQPIAGAVVRLARLRAPEAEPAVTRTDTGGHFALGDLRPGRWSASAAAEGHAPAQVEEVILAPGIETALELRLARGGRAITGVVTDRTGGPVAGALVEAAPLAGLFDTGGARAAATFSGRDGRYRLDVIEGRHRLRAWHPDYVGDSRTLEVGPAGAVADFALMPAGSIEGVVLERGSGAPVPGAEVTHEREALAGLFGDAVSVVGRRRGSVTADAEGRFRITGLEPGGIRLEARAPGKATPDPAVVSLGVAEQVSGIQLFVGRGYAVRGRASYEDGTPAAGVEVSAIGPRGDREALAGPDGAFAIEGLAPGAYRVTARGGQALESQRPRRVVVRDADAEGIDLVLARAATITGRVEPPGRALVRTKLDLEGASPGAWPGLTGAHTLSRDDGTFTLEGVAPGKRVLEARAASGRRGEVSLDVPPQGATGVVITLADHAGVAGRVSDEGGAPVPGVVVNASRASGGGERVTLLVNGVDARAARAVTGAQGEFSISGLDAGDYELFVTDDAGERLVLAGGAEPPRITLRADERKDGVALVLEARDGAINGTVLGPDGQPLPDAWVAAAPIRELPAPPPPDKRGGARVHKVMAFESDDGDERRGSTAVLTDEEGRFTITGLRRGAYRVLGEGLRGTARGMLPRVQTGERVTLQLASLSKLEGKVTSGGKPVREFAVEITGPTLRAQSFRDERGAFVLERVDPGDYEVKVTAPEGQATVKATVGPEGKPVEVALVSMGKVVGKVLRADGSPLVGAGVALVPPPDAQGRVRVEIRGDELPTTGADGSFSAEIGAGRHLLLVLGGGMGPTVRKEVEVAVGQVVDVGTLQAEEGGGHPAPPGPP